MRDESATHRQAESTTDAIAWKVAKLRWLGHEREADDLAHARHAPPIGGSLTEPAETD